MLREERSAARKQEGWGTGLEGMPKGKNIGLLFPRLLANVVKESRFRAVSNTLRIESNFLFLSISSVYFLFSTFHHASRCGWRGGWRQALQAEDCR